jgi:phage terminase small subunit
MTGQKKLNRRQLKFIENCVSGMGVVEAYTKAGYKPRSDYDASRKAYRLWKDERVRAEIDKRFEEIRRQAWERLRELAPLAREVLKNPKSTNIQKASARDTLRRLGEPVK